MTKPKTTLQKIAVYQEKIEVFRRKIEALRAACPHRAVKPKQRTCGFDGYSTEYVTSCACSDCGKTWYHDGWCSGDAHRSPVRSVL